MITNASQSSSKQSVAVGIDLGTTISVLAYVDAKGQLNMLRNAHDEALHPSAIFFGDSIIVGRDALPLGLEAPEAFAESFKRQMGKPHFHRELKGRRVPPEVLSALMLEYLKQEAERQLGSVENVVISVPAYFDEKRRKLTQEAGRLAGFNVLDIINEPTAAAIGYGVEEQLLGDQAGAAAKRIMIYDLGGGTFDVSVLKLEGRTITTLATDGDVQLGGRDFDERLVDDLGEQFLARHGVDPRSDPQDMQRLWSTAQETKHALSEQDSTTAVVKHAGLRMAIPIDRARFEDLIEPLLERTLHTCEEVLHEAKLGWTDLDQLLLVGGSSRVPLVSRKLREASGLEPALCKSPDTVVAQGAALYAARMTFDDATSFDIVNVNAHSLGIAGTNPETNEPFNKILIPRNTPLPASTMCKFITRRPNQPSVVVNVVEGESENPQFCMPLGKCVVQLEPHLPMGTDVEVSCRYDANGTIAVSARVPRTRRSAFVEVRRDATRTLEPLSVWRTRLTTGEEPVRAPASKHEGPPEPSDLKNQTQVLSRLDYLYRQLGKEGVNAVVPFAAIPAQRALQSLQHEIQYSRQLLAAVEQAHREAAERQDKTRLASYLSQVKLSLQHSEALLNHTTAVLGRECLGARFCPPGAESHLTEISRLQTALDEPEL